VVLERGLNGMISFMNVDAWVQYGMDKGWISPPYCGIHDIAHPSDYEEMNRIIEEEHDGDIDCCWTVVHIRD